MGRIACFGTHSSGSVPFPKAMESVVMPVCPMGRSAFGQWKDGKVTVSNVPGNESLVLLMGRYSFGALWKGLVGKNCQSSGKSWSCLSLERC